MTVRPWRLVVGGWDGRAQPLMADGRASFTGPATARTARWWELRLDCGHQVERTVSYRPRAAEGGRYRPYRRARRDADVLPPPRRVRCDLCPAQ